MEKIAIFSDIHGNKEALSAIINDIKKRGITNIVCLGDAISLGPDSKECLDIIRENRVRMVLGNHELYYLNGCDIYDLEEDEKEHHLWVEKELDDDDRNFLSSLDLKIEDEIEGVRVAYQHFLFNLDKSDPYPFRDLYVVINLENEPVEDELEADVTFVGHEHLVFEATYPNKRLIDVGSAGCTRNRVTSYTILTINNKKYTVDKIYLKYNRSEFLKSFNSKDFPCKDMIGKIFFGIRNRTNNRGGK